MKKDFLELLPSSRMFISQTLPSKQFVALPVALPNKEIVVLPIIGIIENSQTPIFNPYYPNYKHPLSGIM